MSRPEGRAGADELQRLEVASKEWRHLGALVDDLVRRCRGAGVSWGRIARALGVSRQAAWHRYRTGAGRDED